MLKKIFVLFVLLSVLLASCGVDEEQSGSQESVSKDQILEAVSETSEESSEIVSEEEQSSEEPKTEEIIPYKDSEIYPGDDAVIIYGDDFPLKLVFGASRDFCYTNNFKDLFEDPANEDVYYYVCMDFRRERYIDVKDNTEEIIAEQGLKVEMLGENLFVTYATEETLESFRKNVSKSYYVFLADRTVNKELWERSYEGYIPLGPAEELSFNPPEDALILYGKSIIPSFITDNFVEFGWFRYHESINEYFDDPQYDGAYYYVCLDTRVGYSPCFTLEEEIGYYGSFGVACEEVEGVLLAYVTEEQIKALAADRGLVPNCALLWIHENAKEEYIEEMNRFRIIDF